MVIYRLSFLFAPQTDDFPINEKVALQLAGLQAQVALGDPQEGKTEFYADIQSYLPNRIAQTRKQAEWVRISVNIMMLYLCLMLVLIKVVFCLYHGPYLHTHTHL